MLCNRKHAIVYEPGQDSRMRNILRTFGVSALLLAPASVAQAQVTFGVHIGEPPAPRAYHVPRQTGPEYAWVEGYWYPQGNHYKWRDGHWARPPYPGAYWVEPYHVRGQYYAGHWDGNNPQQHRQQQQDLQRQQQQDQQRQQQQQQQR